MKTTMTILIQEHFRITNNLFLFYIKSTDKVHSRLKAMTTSICSVSTPCGPFLFLLLVFVR